MNEEIKDASVDSPELEVLLRRVREAKSWDFDDRKAALIAHINAWADERCNQLAASRAILPVTDSQPEPAPNNSLPNWSECNRIIENHEFRQRAIAGLEGQVLDTPPPPAPTELHRFIYEYDDADAYRSAWFLHRLELVIEEVKRASPVAGWVSVEERLPELGVQVLAYRPTAAASGDTPIRVIKRTGREIESWQGVKHDFEGICHVTHWLPLPTPPAPVTPKQEQS